MDIVCVGDCGIDRYLDSKTESLGGCTLNVAMNLNLPATSAFFTSVVTALSAEDRRSQDISERLVAKGVALCASIIPGALPVQNISLEKNGERTFKGYEPGILENWKLSKFQTEMIGAADAVVTLAFAQIMPLFESILATPPRGKLFVDFMDMSDFGKDLNRIERYLVQTDIAFFGLCKNSDQSLIADIKHWYDSANPKKLAVVTLGSHGSLALGNGFSWDQPAEPVQTVVDTIGAGDSFAAVFISSYLSGLSIPESLKAASVRAAGVVQMKGAF